MPGTGTTAAPTLEYLNPSVLQPHPKNIRTDLGDLEDLTASVKAQGVLHPLVVVPATAKGKFRIIAGHRRHAAAKAAGVRPIPCMVRTDLDDEADQLAAMITENTERTDLTILEESSAFQGLLDLGLTTRDASARTGVPQKRIRERVKIANAPDAVKVRIADHNITLDDAVFIASHYETESERALVDSYLGTANWEWAKTRLKEVAAAKKKVAAVRKAAARDNVSVAETLEERNRLMEADDHELVRKISDTWPIPGRTDIDPATVLVYISSGVGNKAGVPQVEVFEFYTPEPTPASITPTTPLAEHRDREDTDAATPSGEPAPATSEPKAKQPPAEPTPEELAERQRRADLETAGQVRVSFVGGLIRDPDPDLTVIAVKAALTTLADGALAPGRLSLDLLHLADHPAYIEWIDKQTTLAPLAWALAVIGLIDDGEENLRTPNLGFHDAITDPDDVGGRWYALLPQLGYEWSEVEAQAIADATPTPDASDE